MHLCGAYSCSFIQLRTSKCTRLEGQWRCSYCHFHSSCLKSLWQGHKFLCHEARREHSCDVRFPTWLLKWHGRASFNRAMNVGIMPRTTAVVASKPGHAQHGLAHEPPSLCTPRDHRIHVAVSRTCMLTAALWHLHSCGRQHCISFHSTFFPPQYLMKCPQYLTRCTTGVGIV